jgi:hypothetical protein
MIRIFHHMTRLVAVVRRPAVDVLMAGNILHGLNHELFFFLIRKIINFLGIFLIKLYFTKKTFLWFFDLIICYASSHVCVSKENIYITSVFPTESIFACPFCNFFDFIFDQKSNKNFNLKKSKSEMIEKFQNSNLCRFTYRFLIPATIQNHVQINNETRISVNGATLTRPTLIIPRAPRETESYQFELTMCVLDSWERCIESERWCMNIIAIHFELF